MCLFTGPYKHDVFDQVYSLVEILLVEILTIAIGVIHNWGHVIKVALQVRDA